MKIKTKEDIEILSDKIKNELGIDLKKYKNEKVAEKFIELLTFPKYVISSLIWPVSILFLVFIIGFFILDLKHIEYLIYGIIGQSLFFLNGVFYGLLRLIKKIKSDVLEIINYCFQIMKQIISESSQFNNENKETLNLLFKGIVHVVALPMINEAITKNVPLVHKMINTIVTNIFTSISNKIKFENATPKQETVGEETKSQLKESLVKKIDYANRGIEKVIGVSLGIVNVPFKIGFGIVLTILVIFILIVN